MVMSLVAPEDEQRPLSRLDVARIPGHPHYTYDFPTEDDLFSSEERHQRLWATLWKMYTRAEHDVKEDLQHTWPNNVWQPGVLKEHSMFLARSHAQVNIDPLDVKRLLTNHRPRFIGLYAQFYLASYLAHLSHQNLSNEQRNWLQQMKANLMTDITFADENDRVLARQLLVQLPDFAYLNQQPAEA